MAELLVTFIVQTLIAVAASALINAIFPTRIEGPRLSDLRVQTSTYGNAIPLLLGQAVRVAGNVIWSSGLQETANTESAKGGPEITQYTYKVDCAVALGERPNGIAGILKIWGFGKLIYDASLDPVDGEDQGEIPFWDGSLLTLVFLGLSQPAPLVQKALGTQAVFESITVYPGDFTQNPDPTMEAALGVGNVPAYRGTAYVVIKGLQLADFGNVLPNLEFLVIPNPNETVKTAVETIVERAGISEDLFNFDCLLDPQPGYVVGRVMPAAAALAPLTFAHNFDVVDDAGNLRGIERDEEIVAIISSDDLAGHSFGEERPDPIQWERAPVTQLPREASVVFSDPARDFQENAMTARRSEGTADSNISIELAMTLEADSARALADRALWEAWLASQMAKVQSTDRLIDMKVGRAYLFETPAGYEALRVFTKTRGRNGVIEFELRRERGELYTSPSQGTSGTIPGQEIAIPGPTELILLDMPIMRDADDESGFYFAVVGSETGWRGAAVMRAISISEDFITFQAAGVQSVVGDVTGTLADGPTELDFGEGYFDDTTVLTVELRHAGMSLESASDDALAAGANYAVVANPDDTTYCEVLQFGIATFVSGTTYQLTHLLRGKRGTEFATGLHSTGEIFVLLQATGATMRADFGVPDLNLERLYKAVSLLLNPDDVSYLPFTNTGTGLRPYSPRALEIDPVTPGDDLVLSWTRRSRLDSGLLGEASELYTLRIYDGTNTTILRETQVSEPSFTYTEDMQTEDFGAPVTHLCWRVAQISAIYGDGIFAQSCGPVIQSSGSMSSGMSSGALSSGEEDEFEMIYPPIVAPVFADWTAFNQGTATIEENSNGTFTIWAKAAGGDDLKILKKAAPATPYRIRFGCTILAAAQSTVHAGVGWRQSSDGKLVTNNYYNNASGLGGFQSADWNSATSSPAGNTNHENSSMGPLYFEIEDDGTTRYSRYSFDGYHFHEYFSEGRTVFMTGDEIVIFASAETNHPCIITVFHIDFAPP